MKLFMSVLTDGSIRFRSRLELPYYSGSLILESPPGKSFCGLPYSEAIQYAWIETDDEGSFICGEKQRPRDPDTPFENPPFLRQEKP
jgi:hypothetical protein